MKFDVMTLFPELIDEYVKVSIIGRAIENNIISVKSHNIRDFANNRHNHVDDTPYGGGMGMVMQCAPIDECYQSIVRNSDGNPHVIYMSPKGSVLTQKKVCELSKKDHIIILCGHYEGVDQRILDKIADEEISIGDYVLTGGELPACVLIDSVSRMLDGVLSNDECYTDESHYNSLLEYPQYTRPAEYNGESVPEVLISGHHANIEKWRREKSIEITYKNRPDLLDSANLTESDIDFIDKLKSDKK